MKNSKNVSINNVSHNRDYVRNPKRYCLKVYEFTFFGSRLFDFFEGNLEFFTRYQILGILEQFFSFGSRVSISKDFFSPFNSKSVYKDFSSDLSYFYDKLPLAKDYLPVALERGSDFIDYIIAIPVKDESKL